MCVLRMKSKAKVGRSREPAHHDSRDISPYMKGKSPQSAGPLSSFYSTGPVLSLKPIIQAKLTIGQPNDRYEQEADRFADQVMRMPEPKGSLVNGHLSLGKREKESSLVQRQSTCPECMDEEEGPIQTKPIAGQITPFVQRQVEEEEEEETPIQAKPLSGKSFQVTPSLQSQIQSIKGEGRPLPKSVRNYFEPRFGADFSQVRVHTGNRATEATKSVNAKAFTTGKDVVFNSGQYSPDTHTGKSLLAHELTHVVQQNSRSEMDRFPKTKILPGTLSDKQKPMDSVSVNSGTAIIQRLLIPFSPSLTTPPIVTTPLSAPAAPRRRIPARGTNPATCMLGVCNQLEQQPATRSYARLRRLTNMWLNDSLACVRRGAAGSNASHYREIQRNNETELRDEARSLLSSLRSLPRQRSLGPRDYREWLQENCVHKQREAELEFHYNIIFESRQGQPTWGMHPAPWDRIASALSLMPDEALWASPNLITFRRETVHQTIPTAGGETDPSTGVIRVFDVGLGSQSYPRSRSLQLPATMQTLTHEVGHIVMSRISQSVRDKFFENLLHWHDYPWAWITARTSTHSTWQAERTRLRNALGFTDTQLDAWLSNLVVDRPVIEGDYTYVKRSHTRGGTSFYLQSYRTTEVPAGREFEYAREKRGEYLAELYALAVSRPEFLHTTLPTNQVTWLKREIFQTPTNLSELAREVALPEPYQTQFILLGSRLFTWVQLNSLLNMLTTESRQEGTRVA